MTRWIVCPDCGGTGDASIGDWRISAGWCPTCDGAAKIVDRRRVDRRAFDRTLAPLLATVFVAGTVWGFLVGFVAR